MARLAGTRRAGTAATRPVVIIGAGIQGCATAFFMSQRGQPVIVLEKDHVGRHASGVNAGGVRRLGRDIAEIPLSLASMDWWNQIDQLLDIDKGFHRKFYVKVRLMMRGLILRLGAYSNCIRPDFNMKYGLIVTSCFAVSPI